MTTIIKDTLTNEFYCVRMTEKNYNGELTAGDNDFPFWSNNINNAYQFICEGIAKSEMEFNDLTCDGTRNPTIEIL